MLQFLASPLGTRNVEGSGDDVVLQGGGPYLIERGVFSPQPPIDPMDYYEPGTGNPAVSTADYYHVNGLYNAMPYDLDTMGSEGAAIKAREGFRYLWLFSSDHGTQITFQEGDCFIVGYSDDPQVWPDQTNMRIIRHVYDHDDIVDEFGVTQVTFINYHFPYLVYNPDAVGDKFWIYAEAQSPSSSRQHELGLFTTSDFLSSTQFGPVIATGGTSAPDIANAFNGWTGFAYVERLGVNNWRAISKHSRTAYVEGHGLYTSTNGTLWTAVTSSPTPGTVPGPGPYTTISGQKYLLGKESGTTETYLGLRPVDANFVPTGAWTRISTAFGADTGNSSKYPGPQYFQLTTAYEEDGIASIYVLRGFPPSNTTNVLNFGIYTGIEPFYFNLTLTSSGTTITVTAVDSGSVITPGMVFTGNPNKPVIQAYGTGGTTGIGGTGTYATNVALTNSSSSPYVTPVQLTLCTTGGLWQQFIDQYYYITNSTTAAGAAPLGVRASCAAGVVTISWNDCLPHQTYRVYKGSTAGTQATLVGDVTGTSTTHSPTADQRWWFKVVTLNAGVEAKNRVVSTWVSSNTAFVNKHATRVAADGGDTSKINFAFLALADALLTTNDYHKYLMHWADAAFGVKESAGFVTKVYCLGTTRLPRGGDYTPTTGTVFPSVALNTSYSADGFKTGSPWFINNATGARGFFGNGRINSIRRKVEITLIAVYKKPGTAAFSPFGYGQFGGFYLQHGTGTPGTVTFAMGPDVAGGVTLTSTTVASSSATTAHVIAGIFDQSTMTAYSDGVAGTPTDASAFANPTLANTAVLRGQYVGTTTAPGLTPVLSSGTREAMRGMFSGSYTFGQSEALASVGALCAFEVGDPAIYTAIRALYVAERL